MKTPIDLLRRITRGAAGCLLGGALLVTMGGSMIAPMGPTTTSQAVNQINSLATQPMTSPSPPRAVGGEPAQWVPDRMVPGRRRRPRPGPRGGTARAAQGVRTVAHGPQPTDRRDEHDPRRHVSSGRR